MGAHGVEDGKAGGIEVAPVGDVGFVQPAQCVELVGGGAGAEEGDGGRGCCDRLFGSSVVTIR